MNETIVPAEAPSAETPSAEPAPAEAPSADASPWLWTQGVEGQGDRPEYLMDKYGSVSDQARGYKELLMHHNDKLKGFVGAPEGGYDRGEGNDDDALMGMLSEVGAKYGMNQDMFNDLVSQYGDITQGIADSQTEASKARIAEEIKLLGDNADYRLKNIADFAKGNFDEAGAEEFINMATTAKGVEILEQLISGTKGTKVADQNKTAPVVEDASEKLREMQFATNENGQRLIEVDMAHRKKYKEMQRKMAG